VPEAGRDAAVLLAHVLAVETGRLQARPETPVGPEEASRYQALVARRKRREPLQYLTGEQEFWSLRFEVTPAVLIPRPETEGLVEAFLRLNRAADPVVVDVGTGSGCLAVVAAREIPAARVYASDLSGEALEVARRNASAHGVAGRIAFRAGDLLEPFRAEGLGGRVDFILSNPPYVSESELPGLMPEVRDYEPHAALLGGVDGLDAHRRLARDAPEFLRPGGHLLAEIGLGQEPAVRGLYDGQPRLDLLAVAPDLAGIPRVLIARAR